MYGRILLIPLGGNMFESDLKIAAQAGIERRVALRRDHKLRIAQDYLIHRVVKFDGDFHGADVAVTVVGHHSGYVGEFLLDHVGGARHVQIAEMDAVGVGLFGGAKGKSYSDSRVVRTEDAREQVKGAEQHGHDYYSGEECDRKAAALCAVGTFARFHGSLAALSGRTPGAGAPLRESRPDHSV